MPIYPQTETTLLEEEEQEEEEEIDSSEPITLMNVSIDNLSTRRNFLSKRTDCVESYTKWRDDKDMRTVPVNWKAYIAWYVEEEGYQFSEDGLFEEFCWAIEMQTYVDFYLLPKKAALPTDLYKWISWLIANLDIDNHPPLEELSEFDSWLPFQKIYLMRVAELDFNTFKACRLTDYSWNDCMCDGDPFMDDYNEKLYNPRMEVLKNSNSFRNLKNHFIPVFTETELIELAVGGISINSVYKQIPALENCTVYLTAAWKNELNKSQADYGLPIEEEA